MLVHIVNTTNIERDVRTQIIIQQTQWGMLEQLILSNRHVGDVTPLILIQQI